MQRAPKSFNALLKRSSLKSAPLRRPLKRPLVSRLRLRLRLGPLPRLRLLLKPRHRLSKSKLSNRMPILRRPRAPQPMYLQRTKKKRLSLRVNLTKKMAKTARLSVAVAADAVNSAATDVVAVEGAVAVVVVAASEATRKTTTASLRRRARNPSRAVTTGVDVVTVATVATSAVDAGTEGVTAEAEDLKRPASTAKLPPSSNNPLRPRQPELREARTTSECE